MKRRTLEKIYNKSFNSLLKGRKKKIRLAGYGEIMLGDKRKNGLEGGERRRRGREMARIEERLDGRESTKLGYSSECR